MSTYFRTIHSFTINNNMSKKIKLSVLIIALISLSSLIFIACTNSDQKEEEIFKTSAEVYAFAKKHSDGLKFSIEAYNNSLNLQKNSFLNRNETLDTLAVINFFKSQSELFLSENPIEYNGSFIGMNYLLPVDDNFKMLSLKNAEEAEDLFNSNSTTNQYYKEIAILLEEKMNDHIAYKAGLDALFLRTQTEIENENDKIVVQLMIGVAYDSYMFWTNNGQETDRGRIKGTTILADISGAGSWGLFGMAAGPLGGVLMAINGACINSGVSHALSTILN